MDNDNNIFTAANAGDWPRVFAQLDAGADIHARDAEQRTLLHHAAVAGQEGLVRRLIAMGAEIDARGDFGDTPLLEAVGAREEGCARLLLAAGAKPDAQDICTNAALHHACEEDMRAFVRLLLDHGANPNLAGMQEQTPLHRAESAEVAEWLIAAGADPDAEDVDGCTALQYSNVEVSRVLIAHGADLHARDQADFTPLFWAKSPEKIRLLLEAGARLTEDDYKNAALLHNRGKGELAAWLQARGGSLAEMPDTPEIRRLLAERRRKGSI